MNETLQYIAITLIVGAAILYLVKRFVWNPFKKKGAGCENKDCCE